MQNSLGGAQQRIVDRADELMKSKYRSQKEVIEIEQHRFTK